MKKLLILLLAIAINVSAFAQVSNGPPANFDRGMYVDCANTIIQDLAALNTTSRNNLVAYALSRHISYMALYGLDLSPNPILRDATLQPVLSDFIDYCKLHIPGVEIGMVISSKSYPKSIEYYNYGSPSGFWPCAYYNNDVARMINTTLNPPEKAHKDTKVLAEMARTCFDVKFYNDGGGDLAAGFPISQRIFLQPHSGKFDWISIEYEYWHTASWDPDFLPSPNYTIEKSYRNYLELLEVAKLVSCGTGYRLRVESELSLIDYSHCQFPPDNDPAHVGYVVGPMPTGQIQADNIDYQLARILLVDYTKNSGDLFNFKCHNYYFLGNPSTDIFGSRSTRIWPLFSVEFPNIGQVRCSGSTTDGCAAFLGLFLQPTTQSVTYTCDVNTYTVSDGGNDFNKAEQLWIDQKNSATSCTHCGGTDYNANADFVQFVNNNTYDGFMWFTYSLMTQMNYHRLQGKNNGNVNGADYFIFPNPSNTGMVTLSSIGVKSKINVYDSFGKLILKKDISENQREINLDFSNVSNGIYNLILQDVDGNYFNEKITIQK
jgi:hypothetical protein